MSTLHPSLDTSRPGRVHPALNAGVLHAILDTATDAAAGSVWHGPAHWRAVAQAGWYIANATPEVDPLVVYLFAALHDTQRHNEYSDPEHGERAALVCGGLFGEGKLPISTQQYLALHLALREHNGAHPDRFSNVVKACFDADRLNLWRVGKIPDPDLLGTDYAKLSAVVAWARRLSRPVGSSFFTDGTPTPAPPLLMSWAQLREAYAMLILRKQGV